MNKEIEIGTLLQKASRALGCTLPHEDYVDAVCNKTARYGVESVRQMLDKWVEKNKYMPKLVDIISYCELLEKKSESVILPHTQKICVYFSHDECAISKSLCEKKVSDDDVHFSRMQFGKTFCSWHQQVERSKLFPDSADVQRVRNRISCQAKIRELGIDVEKYDDLNEYCQVILNHVINPS